MQRFFRNFFGNSENGHFFVLFRKFLKSFVRNATFVTDSSQNLFDSKKFCDHKKNFENLIFKKKGLGTFFVNIY